MHEKNITAHITAQKEQLRKYYIDLRNNIPDDKKQTASLELAKRFCALPQYKTSKNIALYFPCKGEISTIPIINAILKDQKNCYLPKMDLSQKCVLNFVKYDLSTELVLNKFNISEPAKIINSTTTIEPHNLDIIIVPCVAYDNMLYRLGLGGGYYDKIIKDVRRAVNNAHNNQQNLTPNLPSNLIVPHSPKIFGVAFALQEVAQVPLEEWDMPLDLIITERAIVKSSQNN